MSRARPGGPAPQLGEAEHRAEQGAAGEREERARRRELEEKRAAALETAKALQQLQMALYKCLHKPA